MVSLMINILGKSNDIENLWIIIYEDHLIPKTITNNIILVLPKKKIISVFCVL